MTIKSNTAAATAASSALKGKATLDNQTITYASETNITAISTGKSSGEAGRTAVSSYQKLLAGDAANVASLGAEFQEIDRKITQALERNF